MVNKKLAVGIFMFLSIVAFSLLVSFLIISGNKKARQSALEQARQEFSKGFGDDFVEIKVIKPEEFDQLGEHLENGWEYICTEILNPNDLDTKYKLYNIYIGLK